MKSSVIRLAGLLLLTAPGLLLLTLALSADFGPLESPGSRFGPVQILLLVMSVFALGYGMFVHAKAVKDQKTGSRPYTTTVLFVTTPTAIVIVLTLIVAELAAGLLTPVTSPGLIFPPNSSAGFQTSEFEWAVKTNSLGIRDREIEPEHKAGTRILAIGDSFTNGWGVSSDESWPKGLELRLRQAGRDVEVFNLGGAGASPQDYTLVAQRAVPKLRPDLVLIGMLQGDDLAQLHFQQGKFDRSKMQRLVERWLPNLSRGLALIGAAKPLEISPGQMRSIWQHQVRTIVEENLTAEQKQRWDRLDAHVRQLYTGGDLNPALLRFALEHPDFLAFTLDAENPEVGHAINAMATQLIAVREIAAEVGAEVVVVSVPLGPYVSRRLWESLRRLGFSLPEAALQDTSPDDVIRTACQKAGIEFLTVTERFRRACTRRALYYEFDSHFNPAGQALFATAVSEFLLQRGVGDPLHE